MRYALAAVLIVASFLLSVLVSASLTEDQQRKQSKRPQVIHPNTPEFEEMVHKIKRGEFTKNYKPDKQPTPNKEKQNDQRSSTKGQRKHTEL